MNQADVLLQRIDLNYPPLAAVKKSFEQNDRENGIRELIEHFARRGTPVYLFTREDAGRIRDDGITGEADEVIDHLIFGHRFEKDIDWFFNPTAETSRDNEWSWSLYRNIYWQPLARAYAKTGDEKYAREFISQMKSFAAAWPVEPFMTDTSFETKFKFPGHAWRTIEAGIRIYTTWLPCYAVFKNSPSWDTEGWITFLNLIFDHAEFLKTHYSNHDRSSNWLTMEASALLQIGIMFPEMKNAGEWKLLGYRRVMHELKYSFDNDGIHMERTPIYHLVAAIAFLQALQLCRLNNMSIPPYAWPTLVKSAEFLMALIKPDFSTPMIGDADRTSLLDRRCDESLYEGMNITFDPLDLNELRGFFRFFADMTGRDDFRWFASGRREGHEPRKRCFSFGDAGIYVMRSGWSGTDSYMLVHGVQLERGERSTHSHNDAGHLELSIQGEDVLIDSGRYIYNSSCWKDWRHYFTSAKAHNTLYIDDHEMGTVPNVSRVRGVRTFCHFFEETPQYRLIDISHNGYAFMDDPVFHRRRVIGLEGDIFVVDDQLSGPGLARHDFRLYFNFAPGKLINAGKNRWHYRSLSGKEFSCASIINEGLSVTLLKGSEDPAGGWVSFGYPVRKAAPQLYLSASGPVPLRFLSVFTPGDISVSGTGDLTEARLLFSGSRNISIKLAGDAIIMNPRS
jgi:hypothetical protein